MSMNLNYKLQKFEKKLKIELKLRKKKIIMKLN